MPIRRIAPSFHERVWGVTKLEPWFAGVASESKKIGEAWFEPPEDLATTLPLMVKFIFTSEKLSVQVHPDDAYARTRHNCPGKTEMWHVLAAEPGARIAAGFREPVTRERIRQAALSGEIESLLEWHDAAAGDTFFIPAGTVHAMGPGLVMCEIQQHSHITYRLYDYGRGRELHLEDALNVIQDDRGEVRVIPNTPMLVNCNHFSVSQWEIEAAEAHRTPGPAYYIVIEGAGTIAGESTRAGNVWLADESMNVEFDGPMTLLVAQSSKE